MNYNYMRGKQMVIHDPRMCWIYDGRITLLTPPAAYNTWRVTLADTLEHILDHASKVAEGAGGLDAIHFMAHGTPGYLQMGVDGASMKNVELWGKLQKKVRVIIIYGRKVGGDMNPNPDGDG